MDLATIVILFYRSRKVVGATLFIFILVGVLFMFMRLPSHEYSAVIEIGGRILQTKDAQTFFPIEAPETSKLKLERVYIPTIIREMYQDDVEQIRNIPKFTVAIPRGSYNGIAVIARSTEASAATIIDLQKRIAAALIADHERILKEQSDAGIVTISSRVIGPVKGLGTVGLPRIVFPAVFGFLGLLLAILTVLLIYLVRSLREIIRSAPVEEKFKS